MPKEIVFTRHGRHRRDLRAIKRQWLRAVVNSPDRVSDAKGARAQRREKTIDAAGGRRLVAIVNETPRKALIITAYFED